MALLLWEKKNENQKIPVKPPDPGNLWWAENYYNVSRFELEESSEFLEPVDRFQAEENDYAALEEIKTKVHPPASNTHFAYNRVPW